MAAAVAVTIGGLLLLLAFGRQTAPTTDSILSSAPTTELLTPSAQLAPTTTNPEPDPSTTEATVPTTTAPPGPYTDNLQQMLGVTAEELPMVELVNKCAPHLKIGAAKPTALGEPPAFFAQSRFWLRYRVSGADIFVTFFAVVNTGPPMDTVTTVNLASGQPALIGTFEGSLLANVTEPAAECPLMQVIATTNDASVFAQQLSIAEFVG